VKTQGVGALPPYGLTSMRLAYLGRRSIGARTQSARFIPKRDSKTTIKVMTKVTMITAPRNTQWLVICCGSTATEPCAGSPSDPCGQAARTLPPGGKSEFPSGAGQNAIEDGLTVHYHRVIAVWRKPRMFRMSYFPLACAALAGSLVAVSAQAMLFSSRDSQLTVPDVTLVAEEECPAGYTLHPRLHLCVAEPTCPPGSTLHPRLHLCVTAPTCPSGSTWHPQLHRCVTP
jgi:hypothetical protein